MDTHLRITEDGRTLSADETPDGYDELGPGDTFSASRDWLRPRRHWHFLERVEDDATSAQVELGEPPNDPLQQLRAAYDLEDYHLVGGALKEVGVKVPRRKADRFALAEELLG